MIICGTGHRPDKLGGYGNDVLNKLIKLVEDELLILSPHKVISGVAIGYDTALAIATLRLNIPLACAVPFLGQENMWHKESKERYNKILSKSEVIIVSEGGYSPEKMQKRNEWMVDNSDTVLALWDGSKGGTGNCVKYAIKVNKPIINIYDKWK